MLKQMQSMAEVSDLNEESTLDEIGSLVDDLIAAMH